MVGSPTKRARFTVAYDGAPFHGFAQSAGVPTVLGALREAIELVVREPVELFGAGRTDAGVHAWGQVVSVDLPESVDLGALADRLNRLCGPAISVRTAEWATDPSFHARFSARSRCYRYHVLNDAHPNPFLAATTWHVREPLDLWAMRLGCDPLIGEHDFTSFCRRPKDARPAPDVSVDPAVVSHADRGNPGRHVTRRAGSEGPASLVRRVLDATWAVVEHEQAERLLRFEIRANAFCHQMVRSIVGTLVDVGRGRLPAGDVLAILRARDRRVAGQVAPPHGLTLWHVAYEGE